VLRTARNKRFVFFTVIMPVAFFFIFTSTIGKNTKIGDVDWTAYYLMSMTVYGVVGASLTSFSQRMSKERSQGWIRLMRITPLPSWSYVFSKVASQGAINLIIILMMFIIGGFGKSIDLSAAAWVESGLWIWLGGFSFMALGTLLGTMRNADTVQVLSMILYMGLSVLGGKVELTEEPSRFKLVVADDGIGVDIAACESVKSGSGLRGLKERLKLVEGDLNFESAVGRGVTVTFTVPLVTKSIETGESSR
jgi:ABC-type transport system involved in cytochrome c biogenesis permease component